MDNNDPRFDRIDERFERIDERLERLDHLSEQTREEMRSVDVRLTKIETQLDQMPTKAELELAINSVVKWVVGTMLGAGVVAVTVMTFILNNAVPKQAAAPPAPIIIQLPPGTQVVPSKPP
ncbi:hemolysin XhlA family protein [Massilia solisilvae]|uniref:Hemolysin XhlA family protein n=1 Tax=Massilia solisilvae TaxID=1811225 RepID=A0ABT2BL64_9BURK|nr:hemolysin XhlA family protein [Massilia solisilvae]MCS0609239.1 hemolysin XhlA family protein [Massilia solisilvae]